MNTLTCLALIAYMEARGESLQTKNYVIQAAYSIAEQENTTVCGTLRKRGIYSWMWDRKQTKVDKTMLVNLKKILSFRRKEGFNRRFFNHCRLGKRFKTENRMIKSGKLCFY